MPCACTATTAVADRVRCLSPPAQASSPGSSRTRLLQDALWRGLRLKSGSRSVAPGDCERLEAGPTAQRWYCVTARRSTAQLVVGADGARLAACARRRASHRAERAYGQMRGGGEFRLRAAASQRRLPMVPGRAGARAAAAAGRTRFDGVVDCAMQHAARLLALEGGRSRARSPPHRGHVLGELDAA